MIDEDITEEIKLYLCDGHGCALKYPELCFKNGGECIHTADPEHSIKKKLGDNFPETIWCNPYHDKLQIEEIDSTHVLEHFQGITQ